ncbi:MAG TPA: hypothetical protein VEC35_24905 [Noviherbaspirillum sp.]|nr:hypothetical protein [Noviherbaspirillum sp.]
MLITLTSTARLVAVPPTLSVAVAVTLYVPAPTFVQLNAYGATLVLPSKEVPLWNATCVIGLFVPLDAAVALRFTVAGAINWVVGPLKSIVGAPNTWIAAAVGSISNFVFKAYHARKEDVCHENQEPSRQTCRPFPQNCLNNLVMAR